MKFRTSIILTVVISAIIGATLGVSAAGWNRPSEETYRYLDLFGTVFVQIKERHVESKTDKELIEAAIRGMLSSLDKHSSYLDQRQYSYMKEQTSGEFFGIGAEVSYEKEKGAIKVMPYEGSPADEAGLKPGDLVIKVNDKLVSKMDLMQSVNLIKGPKGTKVKLTVVREGVEKPFMITVVRDKIKIKVVRSRIIDNSVLYIRLSSFSEMAAREIILAMADMVIGCRATNCKEYKGLVLDLRGNPGGLLNQAIEISDLFLDEGRIVYTKGRDGKINSAADAREGQIVPKNFPIVVLVNQFSASASEVVAGSLKDLKRAVIVGVKTYGKGSVQNIMSLPGGGALRLTIAKYYTASGRVIHGVGITPDLKVELKKDEKLERDKIDTQLKAAIKVIKFGINR